MLALMYHIIEQIDGERFMCLLPYKLATVIKLWLLERLDMAESLHRRHRRIFISFVLVFCLLDVTASFINALPEGEWVENGNASFERPNETTPNITVNNGTAINFNRIEAIQIMMSAKTTNDIFENAVNQAGVDTDITTDFGNVTIQTSGDNTLANMISTEDLILRKGGVPAVFIQWPNSQIRTKGSMKIGDGIIVNVCNTVYEIRKDWRNLGYFNADLSMVRLVSDQEASALGSDKFNNFSITVPGKIVRFDPGLTLVIAGSPISTQEGMINNEKVCDWLLTY